MNIPSHINLSSLEIRRVVQNPGDKAITVTARDPEGDMVTLSDTANQEVEVRYSSPNSAIAPHVPISKEAWDLHQGLTSASLPAGLHTYSQGMELLGSVIHSLALQAQGGPQEWIGEQWPRETLTLGSGVPW